MAERLTIVRPGVASGGHEPQDNIGLPFGQPRTLCEIPTLVLPPFAQKRPREPVVHLLRGSVNDLGVPTGFATVGAFIRVDALRAFGPVTLAEYLALAERRFAVKKVLV